MEKLKQNVPAFLTKSISDIFSIQLSLPVELTLTELTSDGGVKDFGVDCMSVLGLKSTQLQGTIAIGFPKQTFLGILKTMLGEDHTDIDATNSDASGEILNIIYGDLRKKINSLGYDFQPAIPSTVLGSGISLFHTNAQLILSVKGSSSAGAFLVILTLMPSSAKA
jgi:chemotaxis protein CheX